MRGHVRRRGKKWAVVVDVGQDEDGQRRQHWQSGFATRREAEAALRETLTKLDHQDYTSPTKQTVGQFMSEWLKSAAVTIRASTWQSYRSLIAAHIAPHLGPVRLQKLTVAHLNGLYADLLATGRCNGQGGLSTRTVRFVHAILHKSLSDAVRWGRLTRNPADMASPPRQRGQCQLQTWSAEQLRAFLESVESHRFHSIYHLAATTGMRRGEILGLRWQDVDLAAGRLAVTQTRARMATGEGFSAPKTAKGRRSVALDPRTVAVLQAHRRRQLEQRLALGLGGPGGDGLVFTNVDGTPVTHSQVGSDFPIRVKAAGLPRIRFHDLRHTHASLALQAGIHPKVVSERLGHSTVALTLDLYSHVIPALQEDAAATVARVVFGG